MVTVYYKRGELIAQSVGCAVTAIVSANLFFQFEVFQFRFVAGFLALTLPVMAAALAIKACGTPIALASDRSGVRVGTLWRSSVIPWPRVISIERETVRQSTTGGLFWKTISWYLVVTEYEEGGFERRHKVNEKLLDWPQGAIDELVQQLATPRPIGAASDRPVPPPQSDTGGSRSGFGRRIV